MEVLRATVRDMRACVRREPRRVPQRPRCPGLSACETNASSVPPRQHEQIVREDGRSIGVLCVSVVCLPRY